VNRVRPAPSKRQTAESDAIAKKLNNQQQKVMGLQGSETQDVTVVARVRPLLEDEQRACKEKKDRKAITNSGQFVELRLNREIYHDCDSAQRSRKQDDEKLENDRKKHAGRRVFKFDAVIKPPTRESSDLNDVFNAVGVRAVEEAVRGVSAVILAYGQTGSGKTYALFGKAYDSKVEDGVQQDDYASYASIRSVSGLEREYSSLDREYSSLDRDYSQGNLNSQGSLNSQAKVNSLTRKGRRHERPKVLAVKIFESLLLKLKQRAGKETSQEFMKYEVHVSAVQIYLNRVHDMLSVDENEKALCLYSRMQAETLMESGGEVCELKPEPVHEHCKDTKDFISVLRRIFNGRKQNSTNMNERSSRSHLVLTMAVRRVKSPEDAHAQNGGAQDVNPHQEQNHESVKQGQAEKSREYVSKLILVDLAGNERDTARVGKENEAHLRAEGISINKSLAALGACLRERSRESKSKGTTAKSKADDSAKTTEGAKDSASKDNDQQNAHEKNLTENSKPAQTSAETMKVRAAPYRSSALTRLLKEHLMRAKIFFLACCNQLFSSSTMSLETLKYAEMVKRIKTDAEDNAMLLEEGMDTFPIRVLPHSVLVQDGKIPRSNEKCTVFLHELRVAVVRVMVSHRWLLPKQKMPDDKENNKHKLLCALFERLGALGWIKASVGVVDWIDFGECFVWLYA
jgi:hypothetical protein